jgi:hypothetical protein
VAIYVATVGGAAVDISRLDVSGLVIGTRLMALGQTFGYTLSESVATVDHDEVESVSGQATLRWLKDTGNADTAQAITFTRTALDDIEPGECVTARGALASALDETAPAVGVSVAGAEEDDPVVIVTSGPAAGVLTAATPDATYYLGTDGTLSATAPDTAGQLIQVIGYAMTATDLFVQPSNLGVVPA